MFSILREERGTAATLVVFTIFVVLISWAAIQTFQTGYQRSSRAIQQRQASTTTEATLKAIESELNNALYTAIYSAVYEVGGKGRTARTLSGWFVAI